MGARFRLNEAFPTAGFSRQALVIIEAMKRRTWRSRTDRTDCARTLRRSVPGRWAMFHPHAASRSKASSNRRVIVRKIVRASPSTAYTGMTHRSVRTP